MLDTLFIQMPANTRLSSSDTNDEEEWRTCDCEAGTILAPMVTARLGFSSRRSSSDAAAPIDWEPLSAKSTRNDRPSNQFTQQYSHSSITQI
jgi:hypothetical protein